MYFLYLILCILLGYLLGSIPFALVIGKVFYKTDIRQYGSGNLGGTNAGRVLGRNAGISVIACDILKVVLAMGLASLIDGSCSIWCGVADHTAAKSGRSAGKVGDALGNEPAGAAFGGGKGKTA